jgi:hypothetical protein
MSAPKTLIQSAVIVKGSRKAAERNRLRNEENARRRRELEGAARRRGLTGLGTAMASEDARERSKYLDSLIQNGRNLIR